MLVHIPLEPSIFWQDEKIHCSSTWMKFPVSCCFSQKIDEDWIMDFKIDFPPFSHSLSCSKCALGSFGVACKSPSPRPLQPHFQLWYHAIILTLLIVIFTFKQNKKTEKRRTTTTRKSWRTDSSGIFQARFSNSLVNRMSSLSLTLYTNARLVVIGLDSDSWARALIETAIWKFILKVHCVRFENFMCRDPLSLCIFCIAINSNSSFSAYSNPSKAS